MKRILVVAPHPDDETLGCGGTLLRHKAEGDQIHWALATEVGDGFSSQQIRQREQEIQKVSRRYAFNSIERLGFPTATLDRIPKSKLIESLGHVFKKTGAETIYLPFPGDVHTDHGIVFDAAISASKSFRYPKIKRILIYETLSETEFGLSPQAGIFRPNVFIDIHRYLDKKIQIMKTYSGEIKPFPFPRSEKAMRAQAALRGVTAGFHAAEAFMLLKEIK